MIDTIVLRVHNLRKYDVVIKELKLQKNRGFKVTSASLDDKEFERLRKIGHNMRTTIDFMEFNKTGEFLAKTEFSKKVNASHHYAFVYRIDFERDFIEFNFSIPKYKYGTNILMFLEHQWDINFKYYRSTELSYNIEYCVASLIPFTTKFLKKEFPLQTIEPADVEINRIDLCFNQIFPTKADALAYFNYQKKLHKKHSRESNEIFNYETSIMHKNARSSFKIYHKGSEYKKHDLKEHQKINMEKGFAYFNTKLLQEFADRMLRYEKTYRSAAINYIFKRHLFRSDCPIFKMDYKNYRRIDSTIQRNIDISKKIGELPEEQRSAYRKLNPYEKISKNDRQTYKSVSSLLNQKPHFMLKISEEAAEYNSLTVNRTCRTAKFSSKLLMKCMEDFIQEVRNFEVSELPEDEIFQLRIDKFNRGNSQRMAKAELLRFFELWKKNGSFKEAAKAGGFCKSTMYNYIKRFKALGITRNQFKPDEAVHIVQAPLDMKEYHSILTTTPIVNNIKKLLW